MFCSSQRVFFGLLAALLATISTAPAAEPTLPDPIKSQLESVNAHYIEGRITLVYSTRDASLFVSVDSANGPILYYRIDLQDTGSNAMFQTAQLAVDEDLPVGIYYTSDGSNTADALHLILELPAKRHAPETPPAAGEKTGVITTEKLQIVDSEGNVRGEWIGDSEGSAIALNDATGKPRIFMFTDGTGAVGIWGAPDGTHGAAVIAKENGDQRTALFMIGANDEVSRLQIGDAIDATELGRILKSRSQPAR